MDTKVFALVQPPLHRFADDGKPTRHHNPLTIRANTVRVGSGGHDFDEVFRTDDGTLGSDEHPAYSHCVEPLLQSFVAGYDVCLMLFGASTTEKLDILTGKGNGRESTGMVTRVITELFTKHTETGVLGNSGPSTLSISFWELTNEVLTDLLNPDSIEPRIINDLDWGEVVDGLVETTVHSPDHCQELVEIAVGSIPTIVTQAGPTFARSNAGLRIRRSDPTGDNWSTFTVLIAAGAEALTEDSVQSEITIGPSMNKAVLALVQSAQVLSAGSKAVGDANYERSKFTRLAKSTLGGNCRTHVLACLHDQDDDVAPHVLSFCEHMARVACFPIVGNPAGRGLETRYRALLLASSSGMHRMDGELHAVQMGSLRLDEMEERMMSENLETMKLRREIQRLQIRLSESQEKYSELLSAKTELSATVLDSEEERLAVSKALLDLKIENTQIREGAEAQVFDQTNRILLLEKKLLESKQISDQAVTDAKRAGTNLGHLQDVEGELQTLRRAHLTTRDALSAEKAKNQELGLEVLSLANGRTALLQENDELSQLAGALQRPSISRQTAVAKETGPAMHVVPGSARRGTPGSQPFPLGPNVLAATDAEARNAELERAMLAQAEQHTAIVQRINDRHGSEMEALRHELRGATGAMMEAKIATNADARGVGVAHATARAATAKVEALDAENRRLNTAYSRQLHEYRDRLNGYIHDVRDYITRADGASGLRTPGAESQLKKYIDLMLKDLTISYAGREREMVAQLAGSYRALQTATRNNQALQTAYQTCTDQLGAAGIAISPAARLATHTVDGLADRHGTAASQARAAEAVTPAELAAAIGEGRPAPAYQENMSELQRTLTVFISTTQRELETERADLLVRCSIAEEKACKLQEYISTNLSSYQTEIVRLRGGQGFQ